MARRLPAGAASPLAAASLTSDKRGKQLLAGVRETGQLLTGELGVNYGKKALGCPVGAARRDFVGVRWGPESELCLWGLGGEGCG